MATTIRRTADPIPSSSPAFSTPLHAVKPHRTAPAPAPQLKPTILPILLPPAILRPVAFRTFTKKHNLTLSSSALGLLASFIGRHCGSGWREEGLAEGVLEEVARSWKKAGGAVIVDGEGHLLRTILKALEGCMSGGRATQGKNGLSRQGSFALGADGESQGGRPGVSESQGSFGPSPSDVAGGDEEEEALKDPREWTKVIGAFDLPRLTYNVAKKHFEQSTTKSTIFPNPSHLTTLFRQRYHLVHQRVLRNEAFQAPSFSGKPIPTLHRSTTSLTPSQMNRITPIANLLGRTGSTHLLLALLTVSPTGILALADLTGSIALDLQHARPVPEEGAWFTPGMIVLVEGSYEEDYGNAGAGLVGSTGGIGGTIGGKFIGFSVAHPPCERRAETLGIADDGGVKTERGNHVLGPAFGWTDFLGVGSERATGARMRRVRQRALGPGSPHQGNGRVAIAAEVNLDNPATLVALRTMLRSYASLPVTEFPMAIVLVGNFSSTAIMAGAEGHGSIEYKENFNALASVLSEFPALIARTTLTFVPGDNDAWPSSFMAGASNPVPRKAVPEVFTSRIRRAVAEANREIGGRAQGRKEGEAIWTTNPARLSWFGCVGEMVVFRDDVAGRLRRTAVRFSKDAAGEEEAMEDADGAGAEAQRRDREASVLADVEAAIAAQPMQLDPPAPPAGAPGSQPDTDTQTARRLTKTLLDQSHLSPFPLSTRPVHWDHAHALALYPLPSALVVADAEAPAFALVYHGCCVMNPGRIVEGRRGDRARWVEFNVLEGRGVVKVEG